MRCRKWAKIIAVIVIGTAPILGCVSADQKYRLLSFFFDGVPPPGGVPSAEPSLIVELEAQLEAPVDQGLPVSIHPPYAKKECDSCHETMYSNRVKENLCMSCHDLEEFSGETVHGPVASGSCTMCHDPHRSPYPHLLVSEVDDLCNGCHGPETFAGRDEHQAKGWDDCESCHDPHAGPRKYMLKPDVDTI